MASEISTIQSLKAVDAWIDVINANIAGGVRTAFKSSRLTFGGSNVDVSRAGTGASLPLQFPEPGLTTTNTVIDFSQGAITASTENTHLAIQGEGFFLLARPDMFLTAGPAYGSLMPPSSVPDARFLLTRDGEFHTNEQGYVVHQSGYYLVTFGYDTIGGRTVLDYDNANSGTASGIRAVKNDLDTDLPTGGPGRFVWLSTFIANSAAGGITDKFGTLMPNAQSLVTVPGGRQQLRYSAFGSTVYDFGFQAEAASSVAQFDIAIALAPGTTASATILTKSLEASNASMTQSVPELSLAQKLFSALTKVLQTKQTNVDGVLNLVR